MFKNILIPTDGSELSQKGVTQGVALAKSLGAKVTAFFAAPPATPIVYRDHLPVGYSTPGEHETLIEKAAAKYLGIVEKAAKKARVAYEGVHVTSDYPEEAILKVAKQEKVRPDRHRHARPGRPARHVHRERHAEGSQSVEDTGTGAAIAAPASRHSVPRRKSAVASFSFT